MTTKIVYIVQWASSVDGWRAITEHKEKSDAFRQLNADQRICPIIGRVLKRTIKDEVVE